ncbi:hypothetical protein BHE74_00040627 [Ensete ventricosum]|nr:hypothetical protein BHE74_00040627 [Ensete ventricosum]
MLDKLRGRQAKAPWSFSDRDSKDLFSGRPLTKYSPSHRCHGEVWEGREGYMTGRYHRRFPRIRKAGVEDDGDSITADVAI